MAYATGTGNQKCDNTPESYCEPRRPALYASFDLQEDYSSFDIHAQLQLYRYLNCFLIHPYYKWKMVRTTGSRPAMPPDPTKEEFFTAVNLVNKHRGNYKKMVKFVIAGMNEKFGSKAYTDIGFLRWFEPQHRLEPGRDKASTVFLIKGGDSLQQGTLSENTFDTINKCRRKFGLDELSPTWLRLSAKEGAPLEPPKTGYKNAQPTGKSTVRVVVPARRPNAEHEHVILEQPATAPGSIGTYRESEELHAPNESVPQDHNTQSELLPIHSKTLRYKRQRVSGTERLSNEFSLSMPNTKRPSFQATPKDSTQHLHDRIANLEHTLQDSRSQITTLQNQLHNYKQALEEETNHNHTNTRTASEISSLQNLLHASNTALHDERDRTRSFELALTKQHGETFGNEFADLLGRDRAASRNHDKIASLFGSFDDREFPQTPSANAVRPRWEQVSGALKRDFTASAETPRLRFAAADFPLQMWDGLEVLFEANGKLGKEELKHHFDACLDVVGPRNLTRCLAGFMLIRLVFGSSFPEFIGGDMREREKLYTLIAMRGKTFPLCTPTPQRELISPQTGRQPYTAPTTQRANCSSRSLLS